MHVKYCRYSHTELVRRLRVVSEKYKSLYSSTWLKYNPHIRYTDGNGTNILEGDHLVLADIFFSFKVKECYTGTITGANTLASYLGFDSDRFKEPRILMMKWLRENPSIWGNDSYGCLFSWPYECAFGIPMSENSSVLVPSNERLTPDIISTHFNTVSMNVLKYYEPSLLKTCKSVTKDIIQNMKLKFKKVKNYLS